MSKLKFLKDGMLGTVPSWYIQHPLRTEGCRTRIEAMEGENPYALHISINVGVATTTEWGGQGKMGKEQYWVLEMKSYIHLRHWNGAYTPR